MLSASVKIQHHTHRDSFVSASLLLTTFLTMLQTLIISALLSSWLIQSVICLNQLLLNVSTSSPIDSYLAQAKKISQKQKAEMVYNTTELLDRLLMGYDKKLRPGFGGRCASLFYV